MSSSERLRLYVSPWLALLLGAFVLLSSPALLAALLTAALVHELAHWAVLRCLGGEVRSLQLGLLGARMEIAHPERLSYGGEILVTAAGPLVNLLLAPGLAWLGREEEVFWLFAGAQLVLGCFNLLPVRPLDGGRLLWLVVAWRYGPFRADRLCAAVGGAAALALTAGSAALCLRTGSAPFLMIGALGTLFAALGGKKGLSNLRKTCKI